MINILTICITLSFLTGNVVTEENKSYAGTYLIVAPRVVRPGLPYSVSVNLLNVPKDNIIRVEIRNQKNESVGQHFQHSIKLGEPVTATIDNVDPTKLINGGQYKVYVKGETAVGDTVFFEHEESVQFNGKSLSVFVQTDKSVYKPSSLVHFRVVVVNPDLTPYKGSINIKISDPNQNIILQNTNVTLGKGVVSGDLQLVDDPPLGDWKIQVQTDKGYKFEKQFSVDKYVLPKFDVQVKLPPYVTTDDDIRVKIKAKYTYGKGVGGTVIVRAAYPWTYYGPPGSSRRISVEKSKTLDNNGEVTVRFPNKQLKENKLVTQHGYNQIKFTATVTEALTGIQRNGTAEVTAYKHATKIKITKPTDTFKPGLDYNILVSVVTQDDKPLADNGFGREVLLKLQYHYPYDRGEGSEGPREPTREERIVTLEQDGTAAVRLSPPGDSSSMRIKGRYHKTGDFNKSEIYESTHVQASKSPSKTFLQLTALQESVESGENARFKIRLTADTVTVATMQVMSRGSIVESRNVDLVGNEDTEITVVATSLMAPKARLIVYAVLPETKEIIVDAMDFQVEGLFKNDVTVAVSESKAEPGNEVEITVTADDDSYVGILAVDQSVLLLKSGNDITAEMVESDVEGYDTVGFGGGPYGPFPVFRGREGRRKRSVWYPWWGIGGKDAYSIFQNAGLVVLTDAWLHREPSPPIYFKGAILEDGGPIAVQSAKVPGPAPAPGGSGSVKVRSEFPETWIWSEKTARNGRISHKVKVPDTITSWITSAFAVHNTSGLGVAPEPVKLEVFQPFFVRFNLPYSVKRGEKLALQVLLFNYMTQNQAVTLTLEHGKTSGFDFIEENGTNIKPMAKVKVKNYNKRKVNVSGGGGSKSISFPIVPTKVGEIKLKIIARGQAASDAVEQALLVEPEGFRVDMNKPVVIDLSSTSSFSQSVRMDFPADAVEDSQSAKFAVIGDIMGPVLQNVDQLVRMPYGCGEQNMLNFVPNIVVMKYLNATRRLEAQLEAKAKKYMEAGYQRELTYKRSDDSFSAFGQRDKHGSTWLTAFVVQSFKQAQNYIFVDDAILENSIKFLNKQQKENGAFEERGEVHHKAMQGGSAQGGVPLTAYVLVALLQNGHRNSEAINYVEQNLEEVRDDPYSLAIAAYALHLANSPKKDQASEMLEAKATTQSGMKHWSDSVGDVEEERNFYWSGPRPVDVEMTAYALLTYMLKGETDSGLSVVRWLTTQRNAYGGYSSTQDTVKALEALGTYAEEAYSPNFNVSVDVTNGNNKVKFSVHESNAIVFQEREIENLNKSVDIQASGNGVVFAQVSWNYNLAKPRNDAPFTCDPSVAETSKDILVSMCCKYNKGKSNMAVLELDAFSGYNFDRDQVESLMEIENLQRVEFEKADAKTVLYFSSLSDVPVCLNFSNQLVYTVAEQVPAPLQVYDYYDPGQSGHYKLSLKHKRSLRNKCPECWQNIPDDDENVNGAEECEDKAGNCEEYCDSSSRNEENYEKWLRTNCPRTCNYCP